MSRGGDNPASEGTNLMSMTPKPMRLIAKTTGDGTQSWRFMIADIDGGKVLPVSTYDKVVIEYNGPSEPIKATVTLIIDEVDIEAIADMLIKGKDKE